MLKISIIIPAYNASKYIARCIESVIKQDLQKEEFEAIIINDGSTDNTLDILQEYKASYSFLKIITTPNRGLSKARNLGIKEAQGKYLVFLDSDDSIQPYILGSIYEEMNNEQLDMLLMNYQRVDCEQHKLNIFFQMDKNPRQTVSGKQFIATNAFPPMVWAYAYSRKFIQTHSLCMKAMWHEDEEFTPRAIYLAERIKYFPILYYNYYQNKASYMETYKEENFLYLIQAMGSLKRFIRQYPEDRQGNKSFDQHIAGLVIFYLKKSLKEKYQNQKEIIEEIKKEGLLPLRPRRNSLYSILLNLSPTLFVAYYRLFRS